jgi:GST-like protein
MGGGYLLFGGQGTGAVAVEAALTLMGQSYEVVEAYDDGAAHDAGAAAAEANAMRQVPALVFPSGETMTESAAILVRLAELHPDARLAPGPDDPRRGQFLRWMSFVSSAIYAHYWLKDDPARLVPDPSQHAAVEANLNARIEHCWGIMEAGLAAPGPNILGAELTVLDLYVTVVSRFRPRRRRFYAVAPRMGEAVRRVDADPRLAGLWARRFPFFKGWEEMSA